MFGSSRCHLARVGVWDFQANSVNLLLQLFLTLGPLFVDNFRLGSAEVASEKSCSGEIEHLLYLKSAAERNICFFFCKNKVGKDLGQG